MGITDKLGDMADNAMDKVGGPERAKEHIGKGADAVDKATGRRYEEHVDKAESGANSAVDKLAKKKKQQQEQQHQQRPERDQRQERPRHQQPPSR
jgi:hypothetical protein